VFWLRRLAESLAMIVEKLLVGWRRVWRRAKQPLVAVTKFQFLWAPLLLVSSTARLRWPAGAPLLSG
jgi:hypothetical protein